ncbi:MAG: DUF29 family protein [Methylococcaceae bacterium]|nr:DUF29 family protein [Methylococcaceae bacterium]
MNIYDTDFYAWAKQQTLLLKNKHFSELDLDNLIDEVEALARNEKKELKERLIPLLASFLIKQFIATKEDRNLRLTIDYQRLEFADFLAESPSLENEINDIIRTAYKLAIYQALQQYLEFDEKKFPKICPWDLPQILDENYYPNAEK